MKRKVLITGVDGFTGHYLATELHQAGYEVHGLCHRPTDALPPGVAAVHVADLCDRESLQRVLADARPDMVAHLAAISFVAHGDVEAIYRTNVIGTRNLLEGLTRLKSPLTSVLLASSANVYGNATGGMLDETTAPAPANDYAVSKLAMEYVAKLYLDRLPITITRPFNYTGVGQSALFLLPKIVSHVRSSAPVIELGNLDVARDFSDVRMVTRYYGRLLECPGAVGQTFNVCSGHAYTLNQVLDMVRAISGHDFDVRVNPAFVRANEVKVLMGNRAKLDAAVGPVADIAFEDTLRWMLEATP